ncbi:21670_t:CDS:10, partial [Rhizophagus irregularis]
PLINVIIKHIGINQDWIVIKIIPFKIHVFHKETLKEIWKFPFDPIDICQDFLYNSPAKSSVNISFLVLTKDGSIWRIQSNVQRNKRDFDSHQNNKEALPTQLRQIRKINEVGSTSSKFSSQNIYQPNKNSYCLFVPPPVFTVGSEYLIFSKEGLCSLFPCNLFNDDGILLRTKDGEIGFLSLIDRIISENSLFIPFNDIEDTKNATCEVESDTVTSLKQPIQAIYTLYLKHEDPERTKFESTLLRPKPNLSNIHNALLLIGAKGTISLSSARYDSNSSLTLCYKEYYVPNPVHSSFVYKNRLVVTAGEGRIIVINFDRNMFSDGKLVSLHTIPVIFPKGTVRLCHYITSEQNSSDGIFYALTVNGRLIRSQFSLTSDQTPKHMMSVEQLKNEIQKQTTIIKELTSKQAILDKINEELNPAIIARNEVVQELQRVYKKREAGQLDKNNSPLNVECFPITLPCSMNGSITQRIFLRIRLTSRIGIDWSKWWSLLVTMTNNRSFHSSNNEKTKRENLCYSVSLLDMTTTWERDIEINLRFLHFPIFIKLALCFAPPSPIDHTNDSQYKPQATYFPLMNLQYDILDFIKPCSQHVLQRLQEERHFTVYPSLPDFITPFDSDFFATKNDFRRSIENLINKLNKGSEKTKPYSDFISSLNINSSFIKFLLRSSDIVETIDLEDNNNILINDDEAWKRFLAMLLGENVETDELKEIIKSVDYAIFTTSISLEPVILNLKKLNPIECENKIPINSIPVQIKITCRTPEVLLLVEEALLSRLQDFCIEVQKDDSVDSVELVSRITNNHSEKPIISVDLTNQLNLIKEDYDILTKMLDEKPNDINSKANQEGMNMHEEKNEMSFDNAFGDWNELGMLAKRLEDRFVEIVKIVRKELENNWVNGVVEI